MVTGCHVAFREKLFISTYCLSFPLSLFVITITEVSVTSHFLEEFLYFIIIASRVFRYTSQYKIKIFIDKENENNGLRVRHFPVGKGLPYIDDRSG